MKFNYKKEINIKEGQMLYGIIASSVSTYEGVYSIIVDFIDWNEEMVYFRINQPCKEVGCAFGDIKRYVFETEDEAIVIQEHIEYGKGLLYY